jgi:hypothetical protein
VPFQLSNFGLHGKDNDEWQSIFANHSLLTALDDLLCRARASNAKLIFQSTDSGYFSMFLNIARKFDFIFTIDESVLDKYKARCGHENVFFYENGINIFAYNPIGSRRHTINAANFEGQYLPDNSSYCQDLQTVFASVTEAGGKLVLLNNGDTAYPENYQDHVLSTPCDCSSSLHKMFRYSIHCSQNKNQSRGFCRRVYELQAMGKTILSNYSKAVYNHFPEVRMVPQSVDVSYLFTHDFDFYEYRHNMACLRFVYTTETAFEKTSAMLRLVGIEVPCPQPVVGVICDSIRALENFDRQNYSAKFMILQEEIDAEEKWKIVQNRHHIVYFTWFTAEDEYEDQYLHDLVNGFKYTNARYITRLAWFDGDTFHDGPQHEYVTVCGGKARTVFAAEEFSPVDFFSCSPHEVIEPLAGGYAIDPFELNYLRYRENTAKGNEKAHPALSVIVPVYNNGRFLTGKCFPSIRSNEMWPAIEVLLVDDGSTDQDTILACQRLAREYPDNIKTYFFSQGGSGSASRPRNKGVELAGANLVSFLDPDNELALGAYDTLVCLYI